MKNKEVLEEEFQQNNNNVVLQTMIVTSARPSLLVGIHWG